MILVTVSMVPSPRRRPESRRRETVCTAQAGIQATLSVAPAQAGVQVISFARVRETWVPACAGKTPPTASNETF